ncbi:hypothetical protein [Leifsonia xyli]|uniref:hypothetical protein n=1 Tax=Leifsonia xyli TaxID=1575 RepID=UPI003D67BB4F
MPTTLHRTQVTHTPAVTRALEIARETWHDEPDGRLLLHLIEAGAQSIREERARQIDERRAEIERMSAKYAGMFTESLTSIREG